MAAEEWGHRVKEWIATLSLWEKVKRGWFIMWVFLYFLMVCGSFRLMALKGYGDEAFLAWWVGVPLMFCIVVSGCKLFLGGWDNAKLVKDIQRMMFLGAAIGGAVFAAVMAVDGVDASNEESGFWFGIVGVVLAIGGIPGIMLDPIRQSLENPRKRRPLTRHTALHQGHP